jgi:catalase
VLSSGRSKQIVERTLLTVRSIEFDALVVAGGTASTGDIKLTLLLQEAYRHCKALAAWGGAEQVLADAGIPEDAPGVSVAESADKAFGDQLAAAVGLHRVWERAELVMASAVPPATG